MSKENLETVKSLIDKLMLSVDGGVKLEITYKELVIGAEVMEGDVVAPDGEYIVDEDIKITVKDGKIETIEKPDEDETEAETGETENLAVDEKPTEPVEVAEAATKIEDVLNIEQLKQVVDIDKLENAYCTISFSVIEGKLIWGEVYTSDYKQLLSKQENLQTELQTLQTKMKEKDELIIKLGKEVEKQPGLVQAPTEEKETKLSRQELIKLKIQDKKNK